LVADPRYATNLDRSKNRAAFIPVLEAALAKWERAPLIARLRAAGIPCGEVMGLREALTCDRAREAGLVVEAPENARVIAPPYRLDGRRLPVRRMPPKLGDSRGAILAERLEYSDAAQDALVAKGVVR
jgi:crotonobetainyl-CoA:carnitine CoA-transferase CaiB-like acyl-CoA transferase